MRKIQDCSLRIGNFSGTHMHTSGSYPTTGYRHWGPTFVVWMSKEREITDSIIPLVVWLVPSQKLDPSYQPGFHLILREQNQPLRVNCEQKKNIFCCVDIFSSPLPRHLFREAVYRDYKFKSSTYSILMTGSGTDFTNSGSWFSRKVNKLLRSTKIM